MAKPLRKGDKVQWNTPQGTTHGTVEKQVTTETSVGGTTLQGSKEDPVYVVRSAKSGKPAGHKRGALKKR
jgi:hypothetical protein